MQALRNCSGRGNPGKVLLNHQIYTRCPRAIYLENIEARYLVGLYFDCRESKMFPAPGGPMEQTSFTMELFNFLDNVVHETRMKNEEEARKPEQK